MKTKRETQRESQREKLNKYKEQIKQNKIKSLKNSNMQNINKEPSYVNKVGKVEKREDNRKKRNIDQEDYILKLEKENQMLKSKIEGLNNRALFLEETLERENSSKKILEAQIYDLHMEIRALQK